MNLTSTEDERGGEIYLFSLEAQRVSAASDSCLGGAPGPRGAAEGIVTRQGEPLFIVPPRLHRSYDARFDLFL